MGLLIHARIFVFHIQDKLGNLNMLKYVSEQLVFYQLWILLKFVFYLFLMCKPMLLIT